MSSPEQLKPENREAVDFKEVSYLLVEDSKNASAEVTEALNGKAGPKLGEAASLKSAAEQIDAIVKENRPAPKIILLDRNFPFGDREAPNDCAKYFVKAFEKLRASPTSQRKLDETFIILHSTDASEDFLSGMRALSPNVIGSINKVTQNESFADDLKGKLQEAGIVKKE